MTGILTSARDRLIADALGGLWRQPPRLPARWFYDETGSRLFDEITRLPEYYLSRAETEILERRSDEIAALTGAETLIELGAGTSTKTRLLLAAIAARQVDARFVPIDVSHEILLESADALANSFPAVTVCPVVADFDDSLGELPGTPGSRLLIFLGSTIGNFEPDARSAFLTRMRKALDPGDHLLLGADLRKDPTRLVRAYDDAAGVTAAFNRNLIAVLRRKLEAGGLDPDDFVHTARWNASRSRIEMWLRAKRPVRATMRVHDRTWRLDAGAEFLTEISVKFDLGELQRLIHEHGFGLRSQWTDAAGDYSVTLARVGRAALQNRRPFAVTAGPPPTTAEHATNEERDRAAVRRGPRPPRGAELRAPVDAARRRFTA